MKHCYLLLICSCFTFSTLHTALTGQEAEDEDSPDTGLINKYFEMSPDELLNLPTRLTTGEEQGWLQTPAAAYLITQEDMLQSGHNHIAEQLRMVPGMKVSQTSGNTWAISTRSFQNAFADKQLVLQDGREIYTPSFGGVFWNLADLPVEILNSIEVIRGPGATLWGTNAVNGIINIQTLEAVEAQENLVSIGAGNEDAAHLSFRQGGEIFGGHYYTRGKFASYKTLQDLNDRSYPESELHKVGFRADLPGFGENGWTLRAEYYNHESLRRFGGSIATSDTAAPIFLPDFLGASKDHGANVHGAWSGTFKEEFEWKLNSYFSHNDHAWESNDLDFCIDTFEVDFQVGKQISNHDLLAGFRYRHHEFNYRQGPVSADYTAVLGAAAAPLFYFPVMDQAEHLYSSFIQDTIDLREDLHLLVGTKFEKNETGEHWIPSARVWWEKDERTTFWLAFSHAMQLPAYVQRNGNVTVGYHEVAPGTYFPLTIEAAPQRDPAELQQWDLGIRHLFSDDLSFDFTAFYGEYEDLTLFGPHLIGQNFDMTDEAETYGAEIAANWHPTEHLQVRSSISYSDTDIIGLAAGTQEYSQANWRGNLGAIFAPNTQWSYQLNLYATERAFAQVPGYIRTDVGTIWTPNEDWEVSAHIQNLFDPSHVEDYSSFFGFQGWEVPRTAYLQIRRWF